MMDALGDGKDKFSMHRGMETQSDLSNLLRKWKPKKNAPRNFIMVRCMHSAIESIEQQKVVPREVLDIAQ
jgi:hypothetical protein